MRRLAIGATALALVLVAAHLVLDAYATWRMRRALAALSVERATFERGDLDLLGLSYALRDLRVDWSAMGGKVLSLSVSRARMRLSPRDLLRGRLVARVDLDAPRLEIEQRRKPRPQPRPGEPQRIPEVPKVGRGLERLPPVLVERAEVRHGEILVVDASDASRPTLRLHGIELTIENVATRPALAGEAPTVLAGRATLQRTGVISVFATADPRAERATFAGRGRLTGLKFAELAEVVAARSPVVPDQGEMDMFVSFRAAGGRIAGAVRPVLRDAGTRPEGRDLLARLRSMVADESLDVFEGEVSRRDPEATTIPIHGAVKDPAAHPLPVVIGLLRNAFVQGLTAALQGPPSPVVREEARKQARRGVSAGREQERRAERRPRR